MLSDSGLLEGTKGQEVEGYEIHMGQTRYQEKSSVFQVFQTPQGATDYGDGSINHKGTVLGTYLHGLFHNDRFRQVFLNNLRRHWGLPENTGDSATGKDQHYDRLADLVRRNVNMATIYKITEGEV